MASDYARHLTQAHLSLYKFIFEISQNERKSGSSFTDCQLRLKIKTRKTIVRCANKKKVSKHVKSRTLCWQIFRQFSILKQLFTWFIQRRNSRGVFRTQVNIYDGAFWLNYFRKRASLQMFDQVLNAPSSFVLQHSSSQNSRQDVRSRVKLLKCCRPRTNYFLCVQ